MPQYRITSSRFDVSEKTVVTFSAENDGAARERFNTYIRNPNYSWDDLWLVRIVKPAVAEKVQAVSSALRQGKQGEEVTNYT